MIFMEPKRFYREPKGDVPAGEYTIPLGEAKVVREGRQVTVIAWSAMVHDGARGGRAGRRARLRSGGDRPAHADAVRSGSHPGVGEEDRARGDRARGAEDVGLRRRAGRDHPGEGDPAPGGADPARHRLRHAVPVHARARVPARRRSRPRRGRARGERSDDATSFGCPTSAKASPRARSCAGWSRRATSCKRTSRWSRS